MPTNIDESPALAPVKATITLDHLKHALKIAEAAIPKASATIPILHSFRIQELPEGVAVDATDLDVAVRALVGETPGLSRTLVIPSERFPDWVKLLSEGDVKISAKEMRATLQCGAAKIVVPLLKPDTWPQTIFKVSQEGISLDQGILARALKAALVTISKEESRYTLQCALIRGDGDAVRVISTDGHRMTVYKFPSAENIELLLPSRFIKALLSVLAGDGGIDLAFTENEIVAAIPGDIPVFVSGRRITGSFPAWQQVLPRDNYSIVTARSGELKAAIERTRLLSPSDSRAVKFAFSDGELHLSTASSEFGEAEERVATTGKVGEAITVGMNADYVLDLLKGVDGEIEIRLGGAQAAVLFKAHPSEEETLDYVVMPLRI